jgi:hypothetical protein
VRKTLGQDLLGPSRVSWRGNDDWTRLSWRTADWTRLSWRGAGW